MAVIACYFLAFISSINRMAANLAETIFFALEALTGVSFNAPIRMSWVSIIRFKTAATLEFWRFIFARSSAERAQRAGLWTRLFATAANPNYTGVKAA